MTARGKEQNNAGVKFFVPFIIMYGKTINLYYKIIQQYQQQLKGLLVSRHTPIFYFFITTILQYFLYLIKLRCTHKTFLAETILFKSKHGI